MVAARERKLAGERAGHHEVAGAHPLAELGKLAREPDDGIQRMAEYRIAPPGGDLYAVDVHACNHVSEVDPIGRNAPAQHESFLLRIVGQCECKLAGEVATGLDDLERR